MANIAVREFTYKSVIDKGTIIVSVFADGKLIKDLEFSATGYTIASAEASVKSTAENFGILGPGNVDLYEKSSAPPPPAETSATTVYKYDIKRFGPKKYIIVYEISNTGEKEIYQSEKLIGSTPDETLINTAILGLESQYPGVKDMTRKTPAPPPVPSTEPPITPPPSPLPEKLQTNEPPKYLPEAKYKKAKNTPGGEFIVKATGEDYKGPYIETYRKQYFAGSTPEQNGVELEKLERTFILDSQGSSLFGLGLSLLALLQSAFKKQLSQDEINKGIAKRYFVQDNRDKKISETSEELFEQGKKDLPNFIYVEVPWNISNPANDIVINGAKFQGSESRNKELIKSLESQMPGISTYVTDYKYLIAEPLILPVAEQIQSQTQVVKDPNAGQEDFRKARFDKRNDLVFPSASIYIRPVIYQQSVITDGLTLYLDAGNTASYSGTGTIWTDLSGNGNNGTLVNGAVYDSANGGSISFDGSDDQVTLAGAAVPSTSTISLWIYPIPSSDSYGTLLTQGFFNGIWYTGATKRITYYYSGDHVTAQALTENQWNNVVVLLNNGNVSFYINNVLDSNTFTGAPSLVVDSIGNDSLSDNYKGKIANILIYNRTLTPAEVDYNFNVLRTRYGI